MKNCCWPLLQTQCAVSASILVRVLFLFYIPKIHIFYNFVPKRKKRDRLIYTLFCETLVEEKWAKTKVGKPKKWFLMILWCAHTRYFTIMRSCLYSNNFCRYLRRVLPGSPHATTFASVRWESVRDGELYIWIFCSIIQYLQSLSL